MVSRELTELEKKQLNRQRTKAVKNAWRRERELLLQGKATVDWTPQQQTELLGTCRVSGYEGQHMKSCSKYPEYAGCADNIQFLTHDQHLEAHNHGRDKQGYHSPTNGCYDPQTGKMRSFGSNPPRAPKRIALSRLCKDIKAINTNKKTAEEIRKKYGFRAPAAVVSGPGAKSGSGCGNDGKGGTELSAKVNKQNYEAMIQALVRFASNVENGVEQLSGICKECADGLGEEDGAVPGINSKIREASLKYLRAAKTAVGIAQQMKEELDTQEKEDSVWNSED